jgi:hypothetical protein
MDKQSDTIPENQNGFQTNTETSVTFGSIEQAKHFYFVVKERLLDINHWHHWAGSGTAAFQLTDENGNEVSRHPQINDHIKIDIPGPGPRTGDGFDWVWIEDIKEISGEIEECLAIKVRPASNPKNSKDDVAHFFSNEATSSFIVRRKEKTVLAGVYGRNEKPNTEAEELIDKARNAMVATGAISGFSKLQWKMLVEGLLKKE